MTWCVSLIDRASAGLTPERELTYDNWTDTDWRNTGRFGLPWGGVRIVTEWCAPILDHQTPAPNLNRDVQWPEDDDPATDAYADEPAWRAFIARYVHVLAAESPIGDRRVPAWKFESNDPWQFTPRECGTLAYHLRAATDHDWMPDLGNFFAWCAEHGGAAVT